MSTVQHYTVYTDGACSGNPGPGGWAFYVIAEGFSKEEGGELANSGGVPLATGNMMELQAAIEALKWLENNAVMPCAITIRIDSKYVYGGMTEWLVKWKANRWRNYSKDPIANREQWEELDQLATKLTGPMKITWEWVEGHADDEYNAEVDRLAVEAYQEFKEKKPRKSKKRTKVAPTEGKYLVRVLVRGNKRMTALVDSDSKVRVWTNRAEAEAEAHRRGGEVMEWED